MFSRIGRPFAGNLLVLAVAIWVGPAEGQQDSAAESDPLTSTYEIKQRTSNGAGLGVLDVTIDGQAGQHRLNILPSRVYVTGQDGQAYDGGGKGLYRDGRFFAEGHFQVEVPAGTCQVRIESGPNFVPLEFRVEVDSGEEVQVLATLQQWFSPEVLGWFSGDHHVHAQHDRTAEIKTSLEYAALQGRANGLSFITEAGSNVDYGELASLSGESFQMRRAGEIRPGPFVGHLNTPGIADPLPASRLDQATRQPLPVQAIRRLVESAGGMVIHTHPLTPRHQLHWMGAAEYYSDIVSGRPAHALDVDSRAADWLLFAGLNLGNRIAASSYTDCALGRRSTSSPGDRRVYVWLAPENRSPVDYDAMVKSFRAGHSIATSGGPLFATWTIEGQGPGGEIVIDPAMPPKLARIQIHHRHPLTEVEIYRRGRRIQTLASQSLPSHAQTEVTLPADLSGGDWLILKVQDNQGDWCLTSPIYFTGPSDTPDHPIGHANQDAIAIIFQISNATRFIELRRDFFAHMIVTVNPERQLAKIRLMRDGTSIAEFKPLQGNQIGPAGKLPVTEINGEYEAGWIWHPDPQTPFHWQADWPIAEPGWYWLSVTTQDGRGERTDSMYFDPQASVSHQISQVKLRGRDTDLQIHGYSEEMPLADIRVPFEGDHWWYPERSLFRLQATLAGQAYEEISGDRSEFTPRFRAPLIQDERE